MTDMTEEQAKEANEQAVADYIAAQTAEPAADPMFVEGKWYEIDTSHLDGAVQDVFDLYQEANEVMKEARREMESMVAKLIAARIPATLVPRFSYRFDKVSVSPVPTRVASSKAGGIITISRLEVSLGPGLHPRALANPPPPIQDQNPCPQRLPPSPKCSRFVPPGACRTWERCLGAKSIAWRSG